MKIAGLNFERYPLLLAPMEGVTDPPFRHVCKMFGADIVYSEFISSDGLIRDARRTRLSRESRLSPCEPRTPSYQAVRANTAPSPCRWS